MILFTNSVLFVHNPKTAGTSLLAHLGQRLPGPMHRAGVEEVGTYHPSLSVSLGYACAITGNRVEDFQRIIAPIRDPYDREVSMFRYFRDVLHSSPALKRNLNDPRIEVAVHRSAELEFSDYIDWLFEEFGTCDIWRSECFYTTYDCPPPESLRMIRVERLEHDLRRALKGISLQKAERLQRLNVSNRYTTDRFYDDRATELVTRSYRWMFDRAIYAPRRVEQLY